LGSKQFDHVPRNDRNTKLSKHVAQPNPSVNPTADKAGSGLR